MAAALLLLGFTGSAGASIVGAGGYGNGLTLAPHHANEGHPASPDTHYFDETGDAHHFAWGNVTPASPGTLVVKYDFRDEGAFSNVITNAQKNMVTAALDAWSAATGGKLSFVQDASASLNDIINIGTGNLAALGSDSGPGGTLGLGGGSFTHTSALHEISWGIVWLDSAENWDTTRGNGDPSGTFDYFTVVAQEIGHALGLGHIDGDNIMSGFYTGEMTDLSAADIEHITSIYGVAAVPLPAGVWLLGSGLAWLLYSLRGRRRNTATPMADGLVAA